MPGTEIFGILALAGIIWFWLDGVRAGEAAVRAAREACTAEGLMLLDDTVAISSLKLARDPYGALGLQRAYDFEYSDTGDNRLKGSVVLQGHRVVILNVGLRIAPAARVLH